VRKPLKYGTCVVLPTANTSEEVLAVSRRNDPTQWGIPGGNLELGESAQDAAIREILEETGLTIVAGVLIPLYAGLCYGADGQDYWVSSYLAPFYTGTPRAEEGFFIKTMQLEELCNATVSPFAQYNHKVRASWLELQEGCNRR
jgi:ADP-ribose pyrophosphatase YjhB (NUDIX family)